MKTYVEIELIDGTKKILLQDWDRIYRILEKEAFKLKFSFKFPFIVKETYRYTSFYFMTYTSGPNIYMTKSSKLNVPYFSLQSFLMLMIQ